TDMDYLQNCAFIDAYAFDINMRLCYNQSSCGTPIVKTTPTIKYESHFLGAISVVDVVNV
ncbi:hypothetical protein BDF14DRAFT_1686837, partial [Spinellus fusiger]